MESRAHAIVAISFLIVFTIIAAAIYLWLTQSQPENRMYEIVSNFSVNGLQPQAQVAFKGLRVGSVQSIRFDPQNPLHVLVRVALMDNAYISEATYAELTFQGISGLSYITLRNDEHLPSAPLPTSADHPARIPMREGLLQSLTESGKEDMEHISRLLASLNDILSEKNVEHISQTLAHLNEASAHLLALETAFRPSLDALPGLLAESRRLVRQGQQLVQRASKLTQAMQAPVSNVNQAADAVKSFGNNANQTAEEIANLVPKVEMLTTRMESMAQNINRLSKSLREQPQSILYGIQPPAPGPGEPGFTAQGK